MTVSANRAAVAVAVAADAAELSMGVAARIYASPTEDYAGPYEATPTQETQILPAAGKRAVRNITINPIPSNYGLITWNGSVLTVS